MAINRKDLAPLQLPAVVLIATLALSAWIVNLSNSHLRSAQQQLRSEKTATEEARRRFHRTDEEKAMIQRYLPAYRDLVQQSFIGSERRIEWIDALRAADRRTTLLGVEYQVEAQKAYGAGRFADTTLGQRLRSSTMQISFGIVHEGDLINFLDALAARSAGLFSVNACSIEPANMVDPGPGRANLRARCEIQWITIAPAKEPSG